MVLNVVSVRKQAIFGRKLDQVREGARRIFLRDGFVAANVDDIAKAAGVSKATLYSYFPDKELMFRDSMQSVFEAIGTGPVDTNIDTPATIALPSIMIAISDWFCLPMQKQLFRLALTEAERFPKFSTAYWQNFDIKVTNPLQDRLDFWVAQGELALDDTAIATQNLIAMCETYRHILAKTGRKHEHDKLRHNAVESAAQMFLSAYQAIPDQIGQLRHQA